MSQRTTISILTWNYQRLSAFKASAVRSCQGVGASRSFYYQTSAIFPYLLLAPSYFKGASFHGEKGRSQRPFIKTKSTEILSQCMEWWLRILELFERIRDAKSPSGAKDRPHKSFPASHSWSVACDRTPMPSCSCFPAKIKKQLPTLGSFAAFFTLRSCFFLVFSRSNYSWEPLHAFWRVGIPGRTAKSIDFS